MTTLGIQSIWPKTTTHGVRRNRKKRREECWQTYHIFTTLVRSAEKCNVYRYGGIVIVAQEQ